MRGAITWRLAGMFAGIALATFALVGTLLYLVLQRELVQRELDQLTTYAQALQYSTERAGTPERWARVVAKMDTLTPADGSVRFWVLSPDPRFGYSRGPAASPAYRTLARTVGPLEQRPPVQVVVGVDTAFYERTLRTFVLAYTVLALAATVVVGVLGFWIAHLGLRPLRRLSLEANGLQPNAPAQRLPTEPLPLELRDLAAAFNGALGRLEQAWQQLEGFNADVAHELRTPLANLIGATQVARAPTCRKCCSPTWRRWNGCAPSSTTCCSWPGRTRGRPRPRWPNAPSPTRCAPWPEWLMAFCTRLDSARRNSALSMLARQRRSPSTATAMPRSSSR